MTQEWPLKVSLYALAVLPKSLPEIPRVTVGSIGNLRRFCVSRKAEALQQAGGLAWREAETGFAPVTEGSG